MSLRALEGFTIGITADRRWGEQAELLERRGASVLHGPTIKTQYLIEDAAVRAATLAVIDDRPDYLVATTGIGIRAWFEAAQAWGLGDRLAHALGSTFVAARGPKASAAVQAAGIAVWHSPPSERLEDVVARLREESLTGRTVAFQHYGERNGAAVEALVQCGAEVIEVPIYQWNLPDDDGPARRLVDAVCDGRVDAVTFTSAPSVENLLAVARDHGRAGELVGAFNHSDVVAACIGPVCADQARRRGVARPVAPERGRLGLLVHALTDTLRQRRRVLVMGDAPVVVQGRTVEVDGRAVDLSDRERAVFEALLGRLGAVVSKPAIQRSLDGSGTAPGASGRLTDHALEGAIRRLRRRLGPAGDAIRSVRSRGYVLDAIEAE
jgi:uroporphyrinogen-III synthase